MKFDYTDSILRLLLSRDDEWFKKKRLENDFCFSRFARFSGRNKKTFIKKI